MTQLILRIPEEKARTEIFYNSEDVVLNPNNVELFFRYIYERHLIFKKRTLQKRSPPWTDDPILSKYKFTNVFRDLDPGTIYAIEEIIPQCKTPAEIIFNLIIYRLYNKIETFNTIGIQRIGKFDDRSILKRLRQIKSKSRAVFTNAFTVSSYHWVNPDQDKITNTVTLLSSIHEYIDDLCKLMLKKKDSEFTYKSLLSIKGIGKFLAYQIAVDIGYWNTEIFDESEFVVAGPGCRKGIDFIYESRGKLSYEECIFNMCQIQERWFETLGVDIEKLFHDRHEKRLNLMAMENCFCEISKYLRAFYGEGRPRNRFNIGKRLDEYLHI